MATYKEIQEYIRNEKGYMAQTCWIAHTKSLCGIQTEMLRIEYLRIKE